MEKRMRGGEGYMYDCVCVCVCVCAVSQMQVKWVVFSSLEVRFTTITNPLNPATLPNLRPFNIIPITNMNMDTTSFVRTLLRGTHRTGPRTVTYSTRWICT